MNPFENTVAVVTGAGGTLCSVIAADLAAKGAKVALAGRTPDKLTPVAEKIRSAGGSCIAVPTDVTNNDSVEALAAKIREEWNLPCRYLVNGAGGNNINAMTTNTKFDPVEITPEKPDTMRCFFDLDPAWFESVLKTNTIGTYLPCRVFGKQMAQEKKGAILNFASMNTYCPLSRVPAYAMSKAAIANFTQWLAAYFAPAGIRVNAIAPGFFVNERSRKYLCTPDGGLSARGVSVMNHTPMGRFGEAADLLGTAEWLLDDEKAAFVTGITVPVDGGFLSTTGV